MTEYNIEEYKAKYEKIRDLAHEAFDSYILAPSSDKGSFIDDLLQQYQELMFLCIQQHFMIMRGYGS